MRLIIVTEPNDNIKFIKRLPSNWINDDDDDDDVKSTSSTISCNSVKSNTSSISSTSAKKMSKFVKTSCIKKYIINIPYSQRSIYKSKYKISWDDENKVWFFYGTKSQMPSALKKICDFKTLQ